METIVQRRVMIDFLIPRSLALSKTSRLAWDTMLIAGFAFLVALSAQLAFRIPTTTVPITLQTGGVLLTGGLIGSKRGALSMLLYALLGTVMPVFAPPSSVLAESGFHFILPWSGIQGSAWDLANGGYILGFIPAAYLVGYLAERGWDRRASVSLAMIFGNLCIYLVGLPWLAVFIAAGVAVPGSKLTYFDAIAGNGVLSKTLQGGLLPFLLGDAVKLLAVSSAMPLAWSIIRRVRGRQDR